MQLLNEIKVDFIAAITGVTISTPPFISIWGIKDKITQFLEKTIAKSENTTKIMSVHWDKYL